MCLFFSKYKTVKRFLVIFFSVSGMFFSFKILKNNSIVFLILEIINVTKDSLVQCIICIANIIINRTKIIINLKGYYKLYTYYILPRRVKN